MASVPQVLESGGPRRRVCTARRVLVVIAAVGVVVFIATNRQEMPAFADALRSASPFWLLMGALIAAGGIAFGYSGTHRVAIVASGVLISRRDGTRLGMRAFALNTIVKSGGLAGIVPYLRHAERTQGSRSKTRTGYLLANVFGDVAVAVAVLVALIVLRVEHRLQGAVVAASVVLGLYLLTVFSALFAASRSRQAVRRLHAAPLHAIAHVRRRPYVEDHGPADEMFEAVAQVRSNPRSLLPALGWALLVDVAGVITLLVVLRAFDEPARLSVAMSAYAVSMLFSMVSILPGGLGFAELSLAAILVGSGIDAPTAAAIAVTQRVLETWLPAGLGLLVRLPHGEHGAEIHELEVPRSRLVTRRGVAAIVGSLAFIQLWLAATRRPLIDAGTALLDPRSGALRGSRYLVLACGLALLVAGRGLSRGSVRAWRLALVSAVASALLLPIGHGELLGTIAAIIAVVPLVAFRDAFRATTDEGGTRAGLQWLLGGGAVVVAYGTIGLYFMDTEISESTTLWRALDNAMRLLFVLPSTTLKPLTRHASWFIDSVRVLAAAVFVVGITMLVRPVFDRVRQRREDTARVTSILGKYGRTGLAHFQLLADKSYAFSSDKTAFVGYRRVGAVAVALGEPIGPTDSLRSAALAFVARCDQNGWTPAFHQVTPTGARVLESVGMNSLKIGEEAVIDLSDFTLEGSHFKRLRNQLRKLGIDGIVVEELAHPITDAAMHELRIVSNAWMADSGHRERTFSLGSFDAAEIERTVILVARSAERIEAFVNVVPSYVGDDGNFDLMRRRPDSPNGVMDLLLVALAERFRGEGRTGMTLGLAPLMNIEGPGVGARTLRAISERDSKSFNFSGLRAYKEKWRPRWEPRYLMYPSELSLIRVGYAVARVGELRSNAPLLLRFGIPPLSGTPFDEARSGILEATS